MTTKETDQKLHYAETLMALIKETYTDNVDLHCDPDDPCRVCRDCLIKDLGDIVTPFWAITYANRCNYLHETTTRIINNIKNREDNS